MLRMSFMPSDFHPILLVLGDREELRSFARLLESFATSGSTTLLHEADGVHAPNTEVVLQESGGRKGLWREDGERRLSWTLDRNAAADFAAEIRELADSGAAAGSVTLECEILNEIKAKISLGEFEDDFLTGEAG